MNFSIGDFHFGIYLYDWGFDFRMFGVMLLLTLALVAFLMWKGQKRS